MVRFVNLRVFTLGFRQETIMFLSDIWGLVIYTDIFRMLDLIFCSSTVEREGTLLDISVSETFFCCGCHLHYFCREYTILTNWEAVTLVRLPNKEKGGGEFQLKKKHNLLESCIHSDRFRRLLFNNCNKDISVRGLSVW